MDARNDGHRLRYVHAVQSVLVGLGLGLGACHSQPLDAIEDLENPETCKQCHPQHYDQWSGSMHAYASIDPVFVAMNKRGQREAQLGTFCVQCHAPMAVALGLTDGTDFDPTTLPPQALGVTCYFCHNVEKIEADHNNGIVLALDQTMRGGTQNPVHSPAHDSVYDKAMDGSLLRSSEMCGSCHDVITPAPNNIELERTYSEWQGSLFAMPDPEHPSTEDSCGGCHMQSSTDVIADGPGLDVGTRYLGYHEHVWPGIDQAMTPGFPNPDVLLTDMQRDLFQAVTIVAPTPVVGAPTGGVCLVPPGILTVRMVAAGPGHMFPSGAAQDRRAWLEVIAYDAAGAVMLDTSVPVGQDPTEDPNLQNGAQGGADRFWDRTFKTDGTPAHFFWDVASETTNQLLRATLPMKADHSTTAQFNIPNYSAVDHITTRMLVLPIDYATLNDLVSSGDLDPSIVAMDQPLDLLTTTHVTWEKSTATSELGFCNP